MKISMLLLVAPTQSISTHCAHQPLLKLNRRTDSGSIIIFSFHCRLMIHFDVVMKATTEVTEVLSPITVVTNQPYSIVRPYTIWSRSVSRNW